MANFAKISFDFGTLNPTAGMVISAEFDGNPVLITETASNTEQGGGFFTVVSGSQTGTISNYAAAVNEDYDATGGIAQYPIIANVAAGNIVDIEATEYGHIFNGAVVPPGVTVTITAEELPVFSIDGYVISEAQDNDPNLYVRATAQVTPGERPYSILSPEVKSAPTEADIWVEYTRTSASQQTLSVTDNLGTNDTFLLPRVDIWNIAAVLVTGEAPTATVEIISYRTHTGEVSTTREFSIDNENWQATGIFNNVSQNGTAYIRDNYGLFLQQDFTVDQPAITPQSGGYYRYKTNATQDTTVTLNVNGVPTASKTIKVIDHCPDGKILKYLNSKGQYRFYPFNRFYEVSDAPELIGKTNKFITNILTDQSDKRNIGYRNERRMILTAEPTADDLVLLADLWSSPRVYLYIGDGASDTAKDWLEVEIQGDGLVRRAKAIVGVTTVTVILPKHYTVTML